MKTQIAKLMAAAMLFAAPIANATETDSERTVKVSKQNQKAVILQLDDLDAGTSISLRTEDGKILFSDRTNEASYGKVFNLKTMEEGEIYLEIESEGQIEILPIEVKAESAYIKKSEETVIEKPVVKMNGDQAKVFFGQHGEDIKVTLFDAYGDIAYRHKVKEGSASKTYDLSKLADGQYQFHFHASGRSFSHTIILK